MTAREQTLQRALTRLVKAEWATCDKFGEVEINRLERALKWAEHVLSLKRKAKQ